MAQTYLKLFVDCLEKYQKLNDAEFGRLIRAALSYKATGVEVELMGREELLWDGMKLEIDRDDKSYSSIVRARSEAGKKGASARWNDNSKNGKSHSANGKNGQEEEEDKEEDKDKEYIPPNPPNGGHTKRFSPPSVEEVAAYCRERGTTVDPQRFVDFYESKGWMVGKTPMKDWKACVRTWERSATTDCGALNTKPRTTGAATWSALAAEMEGGASR